MAKMLADQYNHATRKGCTITAVDKRALAFLPPIQLCVLPLLAMLLTRRLNMLSQRNLMRCHTYWLALCFRAGSTRLTELAQK